MKALALHLIEGSIDQVNTALLRTIISPLHTGAAWSDFEWVRCSHHHLDSRYCCTTVGAVVETLC